MSSAAEPIAESINLYEYYESIQGLTTKKINRGKERAICFISHICNKKMPAFINKLCSDDF